jgi:hypothetical protein
MSVAALANVHCPVYQLVCKMALLACIALQPWKASRPVQIPHRFRTRVVAVSSPRECIAWRCDDQEIVTFVSDVGLDHFRDFVLKDIVGGVSHYVEFCDLKVDMKRFH